MMIIIIAKSRFRLIGADYLYSSVIGLKLKYAGLDMLKEECLENAFCGIHEEEINVCNVGSYLKLVPMTCLDTLVFAG
jgi:hypothetical protein